MNGLRIGSLFSGIGGLELGLERAGIGRTVWQVEIDHWARQVLAAHWPEAARHDDVRTFQPREGSADLVCGGFPCQDISDAGQRRGLDGERSGLWTEYARVLRLVRPRYVVVENVAALLRRGFGRVLADLAALGYDAEWDCLPAAAVGACAMTERLVQRQDERQDYETPPELVAQLAAEFGPFEIDYAATEANKKAPLCFTLEQDSLLQVWDRPGFLNPPYGRATKAFVKKASEASARVTCLLPARTDTRWFHDYVLPKAKVIRFLRGRPKFLLDGKPILDKKTGKPATGKFPSMVVVFDNQAEVKP